MVIYCRNPEILLYCLSILLKNLNSQECTGSKNACRTFISLLYIDYFYFLIYIEQINSKPDNITGRVGLQVCLKFNFYPLTIIISASGSNICIIFILLKEKKFSDSYPLIHS